jgi:hypothetical protein
MADTPQRYNAKFNKGTRALIHSFCGKLCESAVSVSGFAVPLPDDQKLARSDASVS